jgi:hypothetical protein
MTLLKLWDSSYLISDAHEWIHEIPTVAIYYIANQKPREGRWNNQWGKNSFSDLKSGGY